MSNLDGRCSALVVEDDEHVRYLIVHMLEREGFEVTALADGREAAEHIRKRDRADVAVLDLMLPYLDGFELTRRIRAQPGWMHVPIVVLSARSQPEDVAQALAAGANDYVCKPFDPLEFLARLRLRLHEGQRTAAA